MLLSHSKKATQKQQTGEAAEDLACQFLQQQKMRLLQKNFYCKYGELDLIMQDANGELVFVEVRARKNNDFGGAIASITTSKQNKVRNSAEYYCQKQHLNDVPCRFDVIAITSLDTNPQIEWLENAFE